MATTTGLGLAGSIIAASAIGGGVGIAIGCVVAISVGVGDYFLGEKFWSLFFKDDPVE